ncbi:hypothetical protein KM043_018004 [Ampulex compressa]|nr:hypothetical protein KM043_018004 [Ampulex compressa]
MKRGAAGCTGSEGLAAVGYRCCASAGPARATLDFLLGRRFLFVLHRAHDPPRAGFEAALGAPKSAPFGPRLAARGEGIEMQRTLVLPCDAPDTA